MLRDDIELLSGKVISGSLTPVMYLLLKDSDAFDVLCRDLGVEVTDDNINNKPTNTGPVAVGGLSLTEWLANTGQPVTL